MLRSEKDAAVREAVSLDSALKELRVTHEATATERDRLQDYAFLIPKPLSSPFAILRRPSLQGVATGSQMRCGVGMAHSRGDDAMARRDRA